MSSEWEKGYANGHLASREVMALAWDRGEKAGRENAQLPDQSLGGYERRNPYRAALAASPSPVGGVSDNAGLRAHREDWASWIENHDSYVGSTPLTVAAIVAALRWEHPPFGKFAAHGGDA